VSKNMTRTQLSIRLFAAPLGLLLLAYLIRRAGPARLIENVATLGWGLVLVIGLGGLSHVLKTWAWRLTLNSEKRQVSYSRMLSLRLASEAVGQLGVVGQLFGDGFRVSVLSQAMPMDTGLASVTIDRALFVLTAIAVTIAGILAALAILPLPHALSLSATIAVCVLVSLITFVLIAIEERWPVFSRAVDVLGRIPYLGEHLKRRRSLICSVEDKLLAFYHKTPRLFWASLGLNVASHLAAVSEVFVVFWLLGVKITFIAALAIEALIKLVNVVGLFNPGNVGTYEGGNMLIARLFGMTGAVGLTLAIARRIRAIFWSAIGVLCLVALSRSKKRGVTTDNTDIAFPHLEDSAEASPSPTTNKPARASLTAIILGTNSRIGFNNGSQLPFVGALPVLLRTILGVRKAGVSRVVVVVDSVEFPSIKQELSKTRRLPDSVEWLEVTSDNLSLPLLLQNVVRDGPVMLILGDRTYHPSLFLQAAELNECSDRLALTTDGQLVGIYALTHCAAIDIAKYCPVGTHSFDELHAWLKSTHSVQCEPVPADNWQKIALPSQRLLAEQKLDGWLVKPTDGIFARMNRRISIPISRQLIKLPITPNMVSIFTLGVSFSSGVMFAFGGYWNTLAGAALSVFASILDGSDGEVARLKLLESDFGCWLETICDYLYYLFIFTGIMIGLWRSSGSRTYLVWGALLLFGALASFLATSLQRQQLTSGRPEQYLGIWQRQAGSRKSNPLLYFGRHTEFIVRRCFLPYLLLFFALLNIPNVLIILASLGANIVWPIALYSQYAFAPGRTTAITNPGVSAQSAS